MRFTPCCATFFRQSMRINYKKCLTAERQNTVYFVINNIHRPAKFFTRKKLNPIQKNKKAEKMSAQRLQRKKTLRLPFKAQCAGAPASISWRVGQARPHLLNFADLRSFYAALGDVFPPINKNIKNHFLIIICSLSISLPLINLCIKLEINV